MADNFYGKGIPLTSGFDLHAKLPLDLRSIVYSIQDRDEYVTNNEAYLGMEVFVISEQKKYMYTGMEWKEVLTDDINLDGIDLSAYAKVEYVDEKHGELLELKADKEHKHEEYLIEIPMEFVEDFDYDQIEVDFNELATKGDILTHKHDDYVLKEDMHDKPNFSYLINMIELGEEPSVITEGDYPDLSITLNIPGFSGSYEDLSDKPVIPDKTSQLENDLEFITKDVLEGLLEDFATNADLSKYVTHEELIQMDFATVSYVDKQITQHEHMVISNQEVEDILDEI